MCAAAALALGEIRNPVALEPLILSLTTKSRRSAMRPWPHWN